MRGGEKDGGLMEDVSIGPAPVDRAGLSRWMKWALGVDVMESALTPGNDSPMDYLEWVFFGGGTKCGGGDCVIWGPRGGGKTFYGAVATVLEMVFRPGIEVMVLGGSREQSQRMHAHLRRLFERPALCDLVDGKIGERRGRLRNGSVVEVLAQSHTSVRGTRPQVLRCDEVDLFDEDVWEAAQLATRSKDCGGSMPVRGRIEAFSTCHRPGGLMSRLIQSPASRRVFKWNVIDVLERCERERPCERCGLFEECAGRARATAGAARGHFSIDDALTMKRRAGRAAWEAEMLCTRPMRRTAVFPEFDPARHVAEFGLEGLRDADWIAGMDFGFRSPAVILWACVDAADVVRVVAERVVSGAPLREHIAALLGGVPIGDSERTPVPRWVGVDPAGMQRSDQTAQSQVQVMRRAGLVVKHKRVPLQEGLRIVQARLSPAMGPERLIIHARCTHLIECLQNYRFPDDPAIVSPIKDGHDHAPDALRYMLVGLEEQGKTLISRYW